MSVKISRRGFLKTSAFLAGSVSTGTLATSSGQSEENISSLAPQEPGSQEEVVLRFAVTSDLHYAGSFYPSYYPGNAQEVQQARFAKMLQQVTAYSRSQSYDRFDALAVCGDMTNRGVEEELVPFCETMDKNLPMETKRVLCLGSHEYMGGNRELWETTCSTPGNSHQVIGGYHFIALSPDDCNESDGVFKNQLDWVRGELEKALADGPDRPIFFFQHYNITRPATEENTTAEPQWLRGRRAVRAHRGPCGASDLYELFETYPQIVDFSGHSHYPITDPGVAWQSRFSAFGVGTLCYAKLLEEPYETTPPDRYEYAMYYVVEVTRNHAVRLRIVDLASGAFVPREYFIERPGDPECRLYTDACRETYPVPRWGKNAAVYRDERTADGGSFRIIQAENIEDVQCYRVVFTPKDPSSVAGPLPDRYIWSGFYRYPMPDKVTFTETRLTSGTAWRMDVYAVNFFNRESEQPVSLEFVTN